MFFDSLTNTSSLPPQLLQMLLQQQQMGVQGAPAPTGITRMDNPVMPALQALGQQLPQQQGGGQSNMMGSFISMLPMLMSMMG